MFCTLLAFFGWQLSSFCFKYITDLIKIWAFIIVRVPAPLNKVLKCRRDNLIPPEEGQGRIWRERRGMLRMLKDIALLWAESPPRLHETCMIDFSLNGKSIKWESPRSNWYTHSRNMGYSMKYSEFSYFTKNAWRNWKWIVTRSNLFLFPHIGRFPCKAAALAASTGWIFINGIYPA